MNATKQVRVVSVERGQALRRYMEAGTMILCAGGRVGVTQGARWLCDRQLFTPRTELADGERVVIECAGWVGIEGAGAVAIMCPEPVAAGAMQRVVRWFGSVTWRSRRA